MSNLKLEYKSPETGITHTLEISSGAGLEDVIVAVAGCLIGITYHPNAVGSVMRDVADLFDPIEEDDYDNDTGCFEDFDCTVGDGLDDR